MALETKTKRIIGPRKDFEFDTTVQEAYPIYPLSSQPVVVVRGLKR